MREIDEILEHEHNSELAQQGKIYLYQSILGFLEPFAGYCFRKCVYFPLSWVFFFGFLFFLILHFFPFPSPSCLFPPLWLFLELPVFPQAALGKGSSSTALQPAELFVRGIRCRFSWYTEALPLLLCFGEEETKAGNGIRVSAEHCLSRASFLYYLF